jgi:hypothetical protein
MKIKKYNELSGVRLKCSTNIEQPIFIGDSPLHPSPQQPQRFVECSKVDSNSAIAIGSTYYSSMPSDNTTTVFDAASIAALGSTFSKLGFTIALADGCGHPRDEDMTAALHDHGQQAVNRATALLAVDTYNLPDTLVAALRDRFEVISEIKAYFQSIRFTSEYSETVCLTAGRGYDLKNGQIRFVGFDVGDCMVLSYDPASKKTYVISAARAPTTNKNNPQQMLTVAKADDPNDYEIFDVTLPKTAIIFMITDGVWDEFDVTEEIKRDYTATSLRLELKNFFEAILPKSPLSAYTQRWLKETLWHSEQKRKIKFLPSAGLPSYGDDVSIAAVRL